MGKTMGKKRGGIGSSDDPNRVKKEGSGMRDKATIKRLLMYRSGKPTRDASGKVTSGGEFMSKEKSGGKDIDATTGRVAPDRRWFGNTRVVSSTQLDRFREVMASKAADPYSVVLHSKALPMGLLVDTKVQQRAQLLTAESFQDTFGKRAQRKRPRLAALDLEELAKTTEGKADEYAAAVERGGTGQSTGSTGPGLSKHGLSDFEGRGDVRDPILSKGTSRRIWAELYRVLDCSDVVVQVLDARDPQGTRSLAIERHLRENAKHKHLVFVLNKVDLVPTWVTRRWVAALSREAPCLAFTAGNITKAFGKGSLIALLRQFSRLHSEKKAISVGFIGYPNVGKSSIINALKGSKACTVAPIPGQTKVWQYVTLMKRVFLIDCPGTVHIDSSLRGTSSTMGLSNTTPLVARSTPGDLDGGVTGQDTHGTAHPAVLGADAELVLKGVVRAEKLDSPELFIPAILSRVRLEHIKGTYGIQSWVDTLDFLTQLCQKQGRLHRGGEPDISAVATNVINDWQRGKLPFYAPPPELPHQDSKNNKLLSAKNSSKLGKLSNADASLSGTEGLQIPSQTLKKLAKHELLADGESEGESEGNEEELDEEEKEEEEELDEEEEEEEGDKIEQQQPTKKSSREKAPTVPSFSNSTAASALAKVAVAGSSSQVATKPSRQSLAQKIMAATREASAAAKKESAWGDLEM